MNAAEFYDAIEAYEDLAGIGICEYEGEQGVKIAHISKVATFVTLDAIESMDWDTMRSILVGEREPEVLTHMSRVVGYFSRIANWNKGKLGELRDRQKGDYGIKNVANVTKS